jgi:hypothetical protein
MQMKKDGVTISYLSEMLEGQVAILSSGYLKPNEALNVLTSLRSSSLYRKDQNSYILYPNRELPRFLEKNIIPETFVQKTELLQKLVDDGNQQLIARDITGNYHFNGNFRNASDLRAAFDELKITKYKDLAAKDEETVLQIFEEVFNHKAFTGRSGTFFAYEGLGSIYWHMVSKLYLAAAEISYRASNEAIEEDVCSGLLAHFYEIGEGIGIHKSPELHGAFPTDAYSHTPAHRGAQQPGMTGQVKEDILASLIELGLFVENGRLSFNPLLLRRSEFRSEKGELRFIHTEQEHETIQLQSDTLCFSLCQIPVLYRMAASEYMEIEYSDGTTKQVDGLSFDRETSTLIFKRTGTIRKITVYLNASRINRI